MEESSKDFQKWLINHKNYHTEQEYSSFVCCHEHFVHM